jgi:MFS-type transporter involved in bile tolerance (Atg22 family)
MKNKHVSIAVSFIVYLFALIVGLLFKYYQWHGVDIIIIAGTLMHIIFVIYSISEIIGISRMNRHEKRMWIVGLIFITPIVGFVYIISARKRIIKMQDVVM